MFNLSALQYVSTDWLRLKSHLFPSIYPVGFSNLQHCWPRQSAISYTHPTTQVSFPNKCYAVGPRPAIDVERDELQRWRSAVCVAASQIDESDVIISEQREGTCFSKIGTITLLYEHSICYFLCIFVAFPKLLRSVYTGVDFCMKLFAVSIVQRADELQTVLMEMVKQDSRHQLSAK
ncbi:hypothetical protein ACJX0J_016167, partial [Zea mays]